MSKRASIISIILLAGVCVITLMSGISHSGVYGSYHDMAAYGDADEFPPKTPTQISFNTSQICVFCHTPHGSNGEVREKTWATLGTGQVYTNTTAALGGRGMILWNRVLSNAVNGGSSKGFSVYTSPTLNAQMVGVRVYSLLCLSCHDGVMAINVMSNPPDWGGNPNEDYDAQGYPTPNGSATMLGDVCDPYNPANLCWDNITERVRDATPSHEDRLASLSNDHPISFDYTTTLATPAAGGDGGLVMPNADGTVGTAKLRLFPNPGGAKVSLECSTCHDVHNQGVSDDDPAGDGKFPFLATSKKDSALCLQCHIK